MVRTHSARTLTAPRLASVESNWLWSADDVIIGLPEIEARQHPRYFLLLSEKDTERRNTGAGTAKGEWLPHGVQLECMTKPLAAAPEPVRCCSLHVSSLTSLRRA